jgi:S-adenosylmethionine hydrolase
LFEEKVRFVSSFGGVELGDPALYVNDILNIGLAVNQGDFAAQYGIEPGPDRNIEIWK